MLRNNTICVCYNVIMTSEKGHQDKVRGSQRPQRGLHIVRSVAGVESWHALWDWLLAPEPSAEPAAEESEVANNDSQGPYNKPRPSQEKNEEG